MYQNSQGTNNVLLTVLIVLVVLLFVGIGVGAVLYVSNKSSEESARQKVQMERLKASQDSLKATNKALQEEVKKKPKVVVKTQVREVGVSPSEATEVVINGKGVRMRVGPGKQYGFPTTYDGHAYTVSKGTALPFMGKKGNWYGVWFEGDVYYVSADFAYLR